MRLNTVLARTHKPKTIVAGLVAAAFVAALGVAVVHRAAAAGVTFVVDADGHATNSNCNSSTVTPYATIGAAVTAASAGDTVKVCPGTYNENVTIDKTLNLRGAHAGDNVKFRTFGDASESTINGLVTVQAGTVKVNGFSITNPNQGLGVDVKNAANNAVITRNIIKTIGSNTFVGPTVGIYLELGPDNTTISGNAISDVQSQTGSAQGVLVGDSTSADPSLNTRIDNNTISDLMSVNKGAYGIQVNNGSSTASTATGYTEVKIRGNTIKNLTGNWAHAIGLEGETPNVVVDNNTISTLTDSNPVPAADVVGVFFQDNPFFFTGEVNQNSLNVGTANYGIAVDPALTTHYVSLSVDGTCNWWGANSGPGAVATGTGSLVSAGVDVKPFLKNSNISRDCNDGDSHNGHFSSHHDWSDRDSDNWRND